MSVALAVRTSPTMSHGGPPLVRLRPAPELEPPYEDDADRPERYRPEPDTRESGFPPELPLEWPDDPPWHGSAGPVSKPFSEARLAAHRYLAVCVEVLGGFRPLTHLRVLTSATAFERVAAQLTRPRATGRATFDPRGTATPAARADRARLLPVPAGRVLLRHVLVGEPREGVAEVAAVLGRGGQVWAMALRLERHHGVWLCQHLEVL
jgi:hypothetical protein